MCLFAGAAELGATAEELLGPVTGELVILYFKAVRRNKEKRCHGARACETSSTQPGWQQGVSSATEIA